MVKPETDRCWSCGLDLADAEDVAAARARLAERGPARRPDDDGADEQGRDRLPLGETCPRCGVHPRRPEKKTAGFFEGLAAPFRGIGFLRRHPRLWGWILLPIIVNTLIFGVLILGAWQWAAQWVPDMSEPWWGWIDWLREALAWLLPTLMKIVTALAALAVTFLVSSVVNAPFYDLLSENVEALYFGEKDPGRGWSRFVGDMARSLLAALSLAVRQALVMAALFLLSFTAIGAPIFMAAGFYFTGYALLDITLSRKLFSARERVGWRHRHAMLSAGLGIPIWFMPLLAPFGVAGATIAFLEDTRKG